MGEMPVAACHQDTAGDHSALGSPNPCPCLELWAQPRGYELFLSQRSVSDTCGVSALTCTCHKVSMARLNHLEMLLFYHCSKD